MQVDRGVVSYCPRHGKWAFRSGCFDGAGCGQEGRVELVNEAFDPAPGLWRSFRRFLAASEDEAARAASIAGVKTSALLASVGATLADQVRALRYRSLVMALLRHGWAAARVCLDHGVDAARLYRDPVFPVFHPDILNAVAERLAADGPWSRPASLARLQGFFPHAFLHTVSVALSGAAQSEDLVLFLYDRVRHRLSDDARLLCLSAAWNKRRPEFDAVCECLGIARKNAVYEVYLRGGEGSLEEIMKLGDAAVRHNAFFYAFFTGRPGEAARIASTLREEDFPRSPELECVKRVAELERTVCALLLERTLVR